MKSRSLIISSVVAIALIILALVLFLNQEVITQPHQDTVTPAMLASLQQAADSNTAELSRLSIAVGVLNATLSAAQPASKIQPPPEPAQTTKKKESSEAQAKLPPSSPPFLDYDNLPKEFLPHVGENEIFMLMDDGSLARLISPGSKTQFRKDVETREFAQQLLLQHLQLRDVKRDFISDAMAKGLYSSFDTLEDVQTFIKSQKDRSHKYVYQSIPNSESYAVIEISRVEQLASYTEAQARIYDLGKQLGVRASGVTFVEASDAASASGDNTPFVEKTSK